MSSAAPWRDFTADPRRTETAGLRASDQDRDVVLTVLGEGYAEGRLTRQEYDERSDAAATARTLGDLPALILDLVPDRPVVKAVDLHAEAVRRWQSQRWQALSGFLVPTLICWVVWASIGFHFPWPIFVTLGTIAPLLRVVTNKTELVAHQQRRLEEEQRTALEDPRRKPAAE
ncbi:MAG: DUF1707 domain-containing protein [Nocardioidaceae bacterium]